MCGRRNSTRSLRPARSSQPTRVRTCICERRRARSAKRSGAAAASRSASTPRRSTRTTTSCARCGSAISCMAAGASTASSNARLARRDRRQRPLRQRRAGRRARLRSARLPTSSCSISTGSIATPFCAGGADRSCVRAGDAAHVDRLVVAGEEIVARGRLTRVDLDGAESRAAAGISGQDARRAARSSTPGPLSNRRDRALLPGPLRLLLNVSGDSKHDRRAAHHRSRPRSERANGARCAGRGRESAPPVATSASSMW